jgi:hypothetical protein
VGLLVAVVVVAAAWAQGATAGMGVIATLAARDYRPGEVAPVRLVGGCGGRVALQVYSAGSAPVGAAARGGYDSELGGLPVGAPESVVLRGATTRVVPVQIGEWPSGLYVVQVLGRDCRDYAPFVVNPRQPGRSRVLIVEPTNTWQAYNFEGGDSWYLDPAVHVVGLARSYVGDGLPGHFRMYDLGFLRWYWRTGKRADFVSDDALERFRDGRQLRRLYNLIVFPGHEEYVTPHVFNLIEQFRDLGGSLAFLSADDFFYRVEVSGTVMDGRVRWRDIGRPEAALLGAQYAGWQERLYPNRPFVVVDAQAAPWLFAGTGLHDGSRFGRFGIEIDERAASSPPGTRVLAEIPNDFGPGLSAEMTLYRRGHALVFDAGVMAYGGSADWPVISTMLNNLWRRLASPVDT